MLPMKKEYLTGIPEIDQQHEKIILMLKNLHDHAHGPSEKAAVHAVLQEMMEYSLYHFGFETDLMASDGYPGLVGHRAEHASYIELLQPKIARELSGGSVSARELSVWLRDWWTQHILQIDMAWARWRDQQATGKKPSGQ